MTELRIGFFLCTLTAALLIAMSSGCVLPPTEFEPIKYPDVSSPEPGPNYYRATTVVRLTREDVFRLNMVKINYPNGITILPSSRVGEFSKKAKTDEFSAIVRMDIQKDNYQEMSKVFAHRICQMSDCDDGHHREQGVAQFTVPDGSCEKETHDKNGRLIGVSGICVRDLLIFVPKDSQLGFELTWKNNLAVADVNMSKLILHPPAAGRATVTRVSGDVQIRGNEASTATVLVNGLKPLAGAQPGDLYGGNLMARLISLKTLSLVNIPGKISVRAAIPQDTNLIVDGKRESIPYNRGANRPANKKKGKKEILGHSDEFFFNDKLDPLASR